MRIPDDVRTGMRKKLWAVAEEVDWARLTWQEKSAYYEAWTRNPDVGGQLSHYMDQRQVRVYIKDTIMKGYARSRLADPTRAMRALGLLLAASSEHAPMVRQEYERPHGRLFADGRVISWGKAKDWKAILMSLHERAFEYGGQPYGVVLSSAVGRFGEDNTRRLVADAASKLGVEKLVWL